MAHSRCRYSVHSGNITTSQRCAPAHMHSPHFPHTSWLSCSHQCHHQSNCERSGPSTIHVADPADGASTAGLSGSIVVFILATSWRHPNCRFSPGSKVLSEHFQAMWRDANENREQYGFLGNTPGLSTQDDGDRQDSKGLTQVTRSY
jgi:hypothetical protein